ARTLRPSPAEPETLRGARGSSRSVQSLPWSVLQAPKPQHDLPGGDHARCPCRRAHRDRPLPRGGIGAGSRQLHDRLRHHYGSPRRKHEWVATGGGTAANTTGVAAGASALKVTIASIAATAAIAAGAVSIIDLESDPAQQPATAAETSSASAPSPKASLPTSSSQPTVPGSGSEGPSSEKQSSGKPHEDTEPEHSAPASEGRTPAAHEDGQT